MRAFIKDFWPSTVYMNIKRDYLIIGQLDNGMIVELFDPNCFAREFKINMTINCLILAFNTKNMNSVDFSKDHDRAKPIFTGRYMKEYRIPEEWWVYDESLKSEIYPTVQTVNGILLLDFFKEPTGLKDGDIITFSEGRLDLLAWKPLE